MALNAAKDAVPPPMSKYGTFFGISLELAGLLIASLFFFFLVSVTAFLVFVSVLVFFSNLNLSSISKMPVVYNYKCYKCKHTIPC